MGEFDSWFCEILFPKPNTHTYFLRRVVPFQPTSFISPAVLPVLVWSQQCILNPSLLWLSLNYEKSSLFWLLNSWKAAEYRTDAIWQCFGLPLRSESVTRPAVLECNAHSHCSSLELEVKLMITLSLAFPSPPVDALVSAQLPFWGKERWSHH